MDSHSEEKLSKVHPLLAERVWKVIDALKPVEYRIVQGLRTYAEQDALFAKRPKVTNARGGQSNHNFGLAVDLCPLVDGEFTWNSESLFNDIGIEVHRIGGLEWGGDWKFVDRPHVQLPGLTVSLCQSLYDKGGLPLVWRKISELNGSELGIPQGEVVERDLKSGDTGTDVRALQAKLGINVDGAFGEKTKAAVIEFQRSAGIARDGIVGENTRNLLGL